MITLFLLLAAFAGAAAVTAWVRTPEYDRPRVYPREPELWGGVTGKPASLRHGFGTLLFWAVALFGVGLGGVVVEAFAPGQTVLALIVGAGAGVLLALEVARRMLRIGPGAMRVMPRPRKTPVG
ncbi:MAG TPA: hypothetical protein VGK85_10340, partial [Myxococcaceae bacterium]